MAHGRPRHRWLPPLKRSAGRGSPDRLSRSCKRRDGRIRSIQGARQSVGPTGRKQVVGMLGTRVAENHLGQRLPAASTGRTYGCKRSDRPRKNSCGTEAVHIWVPAQGRDDVEYLPQPQLIIPLRRDLIASCAIGRGAAAVAGDDAGLLAFDVGVDAGHPGIDLVGQQPDAERLDVIGP